jgi:hypothetical protein
MQMHSPVNECWPQTVPKGQVPPQAGAVERRHVSSDDAQRHAVDPTCGWHVLPGRHGPPQVGAAPHVGGNVVEVLVVVTTLVLVVGTGSVLVVVIEPPHASQQLGPEATVPPRARHRSALRAIRQPLAPDVQQATALARPQVE